MADRKRTRAQRRREREERSAGSTPAPDPIQGATPYVDQAKMAEEGADVPSPDRDEPGGEGPYADELSDAAGDARDVDAAPDELEHDFAAVTRAEGEPAGAPTTRGRRGRFITFLGHCVDELRRVQWPDRRQVGQGTVVTLGFVVIAGGYLGLMDAIWKPLVEAIL
jgi:preprotein translocase SecE subunit